MKKFTVIIPLVTKLAADKIIVGLVQLGYAVASLDGTTYVLPSSDDRPAATLCIHIGSTHETTVDAIVDVLKGIMKDDISYYNIVVMAHPFSGLVCAGSNISLKRIRERVAAKKVSYLKLVPRHNPLRIVPPPLPSQPSPPKNSA